MHFLGGAELSQGDGVEGEHAPRLPGHLPPGGAAADVHRAAGGDGLQPGHPRVEEAASHRLSCAHAAASGQSFRSVTSFFFSPNSEWRGSHRHRKSSDGKSFIS